MKSDDLKFSGQLNISIELPYRVYLPNDYVDNHASGFPLLLFLHGAGERGSDLTALAKTGLPKELEQGTQLPFITVCPQCPVKEAWDEHKLLALLDKIIADYNIDLSRIYVTGLSMGGRGTWQLANLAGNRFAAILPICPPFFWVNPDNFKTLPVWCFHGVMDSVVPITDSVKMVRLLRAAGCEVNFTTYANADHDSWSETYSNPAIYDWLLSHQRPQVDEP